MNSSTLMMSKAAPRRSLAQALRGASVASLLAVMGLLSACGGGGGSSGESTTPPPVAGAVTLTVSKVGSGTVTSTPAGINCGSTCATSVGSGTSVTLSATAASGSEFSGWGGAGISCPASTCVVTMTAARTVTATFTVPPPRQHLLTVTLAGSGSVLSAPAGIDCGSTCTHTYAEGTDIVLTATPASGQRFAGWSGVCSGSGTCSVTMSQASQATATFVAASTVYTLSVSKTGAGTVSSAPAGINCGSTCSANYAAGTSVTLTATPTAGNVLSAWSGNCSGTGACVVPMSQARAVGAAFAVVTDTTAPTVLSSVPANATTGVATSSTLSVTFSEPLNCSTVTATSFSVTNMGGTLGCSGSTVLFTPASPLANSTVYTAQLGAGIRDLAGNALVPTSLSFTTVATAGTPGKFSFLVYGDSRAERIIAGSPDGGCKHNTPHIGLVGRMAGEASTSFVVHVGDMVNGMVYPSDASAPAGEANKLVNTTNWVQRGACTDSASHGSFKDIIAPLQNKAPAAGLQTFYFPVIGNHDDQWGSAYPDRYGNGFCDVFDPKKLGVVNHTTQSYFLDKSSGVKTDTEFDTQLCNKTDSSTSMYPTHLYYSFDLQGSHFVVLRINSDYHNLMECSSNCSNQNSYDAYYYKHQLDWLRGDLQKARTRSATGNIFVFLHAPLVTSSYGHPANASWPVLLPEFSKYGVKMVFSGHSHIYERSKPVFSTTADPTGVIDATKGTTYFVTGGGGSGFHGFSSPRDTRTAFTSEDAAGGDNTKGYHYLRVDVDVDKVTATATGLDGTRFDTVVVTRP